jgi:uncharacterized protein DUF4265
VSRDRAHEHVVVSVGPGTAAREELAVDDLGDGTYRLLVPPALTVGLATGDVFEIDPETLRPNVLRRSGNLTVWLFPAGGHSVQPQRLAREAEAVGGTFEGVGHDGRLLIFTVPVGATFAAIETIFNRYADEHPASEWLFGNVYGDDGVTPLGWWA